MKKKKEMMVNSPFHTHFLLVISCSQDPDANSQIKDQWMDPGPREDKGKESCSCNLNSHFLVQLTFPFIPSLLVVYTHSFNFKTQEEWVNRRQRR